MPGGGHLQKDCTVSETDSSIRVRRCATHRGRRRTRSATGDPRALAAREVGERGAVTPWDRTRDSNESKRVYGVVNSARNPDRSRVGEQSRIPRRILASSCRAPRRRSTLNVPNERFGVVVRGSIEVGFSVFAEDRPLTAPGNGPCGRSRHRDPGAQLEHLDSRITEIATLTDLDL